MEQNDKIVQGLREQIQELEKLPIVRTYAAYVNALNGILGISNMVGQNTSSEKLESKSDSKNEEPKSFKTQIASIFREQGRFLHIREIIEIAKTKNLKIDDKSIKQAVYALKSDGVIVNVAINNSYQNTFWGSKNWVDGDNNIKPEHMYNKGLVANPKENIEI